VPTDRRHAALKQRSRDRLRGTDQRCHGSGIASPRLNHSHPPAGRLRIPGMERTYPTERSIALIGSGVAGLTAAYMLSARDRVTLFEADTRIGGHAHTHYLDRGDSNIAILLRLDEVAVGAPVRGEGLPRHVGSRAALVPDVPTAADSFLMKGEEVPAHAHWGGNPAYGQPLGERSV
jgi:NAD(P)-binding Rossmann-like domain